MLTAATRELTQQVHGVSLDLDQRVAPLTALLKRYTKSQPLFRGHQGSGSSQTDTRACLLSGILCLFMSSADSLRAVKMEESFVSMTPGIHHYACHLHLTTCAGE